MMAGKSDKDDLIVEVANELSGYTTLERKILRSLPEEKEKAVYAYKLASDLLVTPSILRDNLEILERKGLIDRDVRSDLDIKVNLSPKGKLAQKILL